ncbi:hypothetical protein MMC12_002867 [Toensbergia leucococca]|nr:hypothetical protein [Toensbergia leucococca]
MTINGLPPNGGVPPGLAFKGRPQGRNPAPPPPPYIPAAPNMNQPAARQGRAIAHISPPPAASVPPADPPYALPPGASLHGLGLDFPNGMGYFFPPREQHTVIHVMDNYYLPWIEPQKFHFTTYTVTSLLTVQTLICQLGGSGVSECFELGDGAWLKGPTFMKNEKVSEQTLGALGWDNSRGQEQNSVWLAVQKAG